MKKKKRDIFKGQLNKEFLPVFLILATPMLAFMNGFGIQTASVGVDLYYLIALAAGLVMGRIEKVKITHKYEFFLLMSLEASINIPYMKYDNYFNGNYTYLVISYSLIVFFNVIVAYSFSVNDPYFTGYFRSDKPAYILIYRIAGAFFTGIAVYQVFLFTRILDILKFTFK